jgi:pyruvyltransferase
MEYLPAFWMTSANFGDNCNYFLLSALSGLPVVFTGITAPDTKIVGIGSILNWCDQTCIAWGPGLASATDAVHPDADLRVVRGPLSRDRAMSFGNKSSPALGDPVLLLPRVFRPTVEKKHCLGIIPHYVDQAIVHPYRRHRLSDTLVINVFDTPENVVRAVLSCERILSSSLHGIIAAHAYGVPAAWVTFGGPIGGDGMKYRDYFAAAGLRIDDAVDCSATVVLQELENRAKDIDYTLPKVDRTAELIQSAPFRILDAYR